MYHLTNEEKDYLLNSMSDLLDEYDYEYSFSALDDIIEEWATKKATLIEAFKKHPNYLEGKFMIAFNHDYERVVDPQASKRFSSYIVGISASAGFIDNVPTEVIEQRNAEYCPILPDKLFNFIDCLGDYAERTISAETTALLNEICPAIHPHEGEKTSRVINRLCTYLGYSKHEDYNREFAKYADSLSPMIIKRHTVLSINPLDYLTMSFGNSWASCHTIDKANRRGMPNSYRGQYSSGTMSYMLDPSSMVFYTVDASYDGDEYWNQPKINRQMFHWGEEKLVQGRLYPQDNDSNGVAYTPYRNIVQEIIALIFNHPNLWVVKKGTDSAKKYIETYGTHYPDYYHFDNCTLSELKGNENYEDFIVGATPICIECGCHHSTEDSINCCHTPNSITCQNCGCVIDEDDAEYIDGYYYCHDCCEWCEWCEEYHRGDSTWIPSREIYVCDDCLDSCFVLCNCCDEYVHRDDAYWVECEDEYVCEDCREEHYFRCDDCDDLYPNDQLNSIDGNDYCDFCAKSHIQNEEEEEEEENENA